VATHGTSAGKEALATVNSGVSLAWLAGFFFSFQSAIVLIAVRLLGMDPQLGAAAGIAASLLLLSGGMFHSLGTGRLISVLRLRPSRWVLLFLTFSCLSLAWSGTVSVPASLAYWCAMAADVGTVALLLAGDSSTDFGHALMRGYIVSTCWLALLAWLMPAQSDLRLGDPDYFNTNQIANICAFAIFFAQYLARRSTGKWTIVIVFLSITLMRTLSKTTLAAFLLSQGFLLIRDRSISGRKKAWLAAAALVFVLVFWGLFEAYYDIYTTSGNQAETLTGRTAIWAFAIEHALEKPWIGNGFDSMWKVMPPFGPDHFEARHAENEILQQFYAYGVAGVVLLAGLYASLYRQIRRLRPSPIRVVLSSLMLFIMVRGVAEAEPFDLLLPLWSVVLIGVLVHREMSLDCNF
jgi:exopolysaccharide production protein ExoQ